jgi:hypothetical protein
LRDRIEQRARAMSQGKVVGIDTQQLLRAVCGVAFGRARMSAIYRYLRGVDPTTGEADTAERVKCLDQLDDAAQSKVYHEHVAFVERLEAGAPGAAAPSLPARTMIAANTVAAPIGPHNAKPRTHASLTSITPAGPSLRCGRDGPRYITL